MVPTRGLIGIRTEVLTDTRGTAVMNRLFDSFRPWVGDISRRTKGSLVADRIGDTPTFALFHLEERGELFVTPATKVYEGMIIGINKYEEDMEVNPCKERQKSGVRRNQAEITQVALKAPKQLTLEFALFFLAKDEILEITPQNLRLRKQFLTKNERIWSKRSSLTDFARKQLQS